MPELTFEPFPKLSRLKRPCVITEKVDGTNAQLVFNEQGHMLVGSRTRQIFPEGSADQPKGCDNFAFAKWAHENREALFGALGPGRHYGEWAGKGIQRGYGLEHRVFFLFNTARWANETFFGEHSIRPVPLLYTGEFTTGAVDTTMQALSALGSKVNRARPGEPAEGVVVYLAASGHMYKVTFDDRGKWVSGS